MITLTQNRTKEKITMARPVAMQAIEMEDEPSITSLRLTRVEVWEVRKGDYTPPGSDVVSILQHFRRQGMPARVTIEAGEETVTYEVNE